MITPNGVTARLIIIMVFNLIIILTYIAHIYTPKNSSTKFNCNFSKIFLNLFSWSIVGISEAPGIYIQVYYYDYFQQKDKAEGGGGVETLYRNNFSKLYRLR